MFQELRGIPKWSSCPTSEWLSKFQGAQHAWGAHAPPQDVEADGRLMDSALLNLQHRACCSAPILIWPVTSASCHLQRCRLAGAKCS